MESSARGSWNQCYASCPPSTVTIQPPPFVLTIPGPALYCPDQPFQIEQHNPCMVGGPAPRMLNSASVYSRALPNSSYSSYSSYRY